MNWSKLALAGSEIGRALDWLDGLNRVQETVQSGPQFTPHAIRHYSADESERLGIEGKGFFFILNN